MNQQLVIRLSSVMLAVAVVGCSDSLDPYNPDTGLLVNRAAVQLLPGETFQLQATAGGQPTTVTWESSNTAIATVSPTGVVTGVTPGTASVSAVSTADPSQRWTTSVTVPVTLLSGQPITISSSGARLSAITHLIFVPPGTTQLRVQTTGGTGDLDIFVRPGGAVPLGSAANYNAAYGDATIRCIGDNAGNNELCVIPNPESGVWYITVMVWDAYAGATLTATLN